MKGEEELPGALDFEVAEVGGFGFFEFVLDDLLATGGTMEASVQLVESLGGEVVSLAVAIELDFLRGRARFPNHEVISLLHYNE